MNDTPHYLKQQFWVNFFVKKCGKNILASNNKQTSKLSITTESLEGKSRLQQRDKCGNISFSNIYPAYMKRSIRRKAQFISTEAKKVLIAQAEIINFSIIFFHFSLSLDFSLLPHH